MSAHELPEDDWEPTFLHEGTDIFLRCVDDNGVHRGDLRIARAELESYAVTLVSSANAGMRFMQRTVVDRAIGKILGEERQ